MTPVQVAVRDWIRARFGCGDDEIEIDDDDFLQFTQHSEDGPSFYLSDYGTVRLEWGCLEISADMDERDPADTMERLMRAALAFDGRTTEGGGR